MLKTEIAKSSETSLPRPRSVFGAMRGEMDRVFERFEHDCPRWPRLYDWSRLPSVLRAPTRNY
jgi:hypothetical protein